MSERKIIVITPVRNEAWILDRFLKVTSIFADHIIIADQNSTDGSLDIYPKFPKVVLIKNNNKEFNEAERQLLLLKTARERFGLNNILLAIDADEILAANAMQSEEWQIMLKAKPGTILYFEKPTLYKTTSVAIRYFGPGWPLGYVDDGAEHTPKPIHSTRIPLPGYAEKLYFNEIKFLHYALVRLDAQASKQRMYSMLENLKKTKSLRLRRRLYDSQNDFLDEGDLHEAANPFWFNNWQNSGIDMHTILHSEYYWYDFEALKLFKEYGLKQFAFEDIWNFDWETCRKKAIQLKFEKIPEFPISQPNEFIGSFVGWCFDIINSIILKIKK